MCVVSMIYDQLQAQHINWPQQSTWFIRNTLNAFEALDVIDQHLGQPNCGKHEKDLFVARLKDLLERMEQPPPPDAP